MTDATVTTTDTQTTAMQDEYDALNASITKLGAQIRALKQSGAPPGDALVAAVAQLQQWKVQAATMQSSLQANPNTGDRKAFDDLMLRKMFIVPAFEIHGGVKGLFDLGPPACAIKVRGGTLSFLNGTIHHLSMHVVTHFSSLSF
jgi:glycyl-tRNA synthetase